MAEENDVVLIYIEDQPTAFARIEEILADHKPGWYHVKLLLLQVPLQAVTWILRDAYIDGGEFTMGGKRMRLEMVVCPDAVTDPERQEDGRSEQTVKDARVISLADRKKSK